jgi:hypothetical protein
VARRAKAAGWLAASALLLGSVSAQAESVVCHIHYGGEIRQITAAPTAAPYAEMPSAIGSFFLFRIVFRKTPDDLTSIKLYAYANRDSGPSLLHQASYAYPPLNAAVDGFTGRNFVYEPIRDGELEYWCELKAQAEK